MTAIPVDAVIKVCGCGAAYDATTWAALKLCGHMGAIGANSKRVLELRNCSCRSTLAIEVEVSR